MILRISSFAPTSTPIVGSSITNTFGFVSSHFANRTFCWLPARKLTRKSERAGRVDAQTLDISSRSCAPSPRNQENRQRRLKRDRIGRQMFSTSVKFGKTPSPSRSLVSSAIPLSSEAAGSPARDRDALNQNSARGLAARRPEQRPSTARRRPEPARPVTPSTSPLRKVKLTFCRSPRTLRFSTAINGAGVGARGDVADAARSRRLCVQPSGPRLAAASFRSPARPRPPRRRA